jgi:hypothetical protein
VSFCDGYNIEFVDKIWKNSSLFPILRIFILQIASDLTVFTKDVFDISFVNGLGLTSTFPIISVK